MKVIYKIDVQANLPSFCGQICRGLRDETYIKVKGAWKYLYRAVDKEGKTIDFLLTSKRDKAAAKRFFDKAMEANGTPEKVTMDKSGANKTAIDEINASMKIPMVVLQIKYLNNIVERRRKQLCLHF